MRTVHQLALVLLATACSSGQDAPITKAPFLGAPLAITRDDITVEGDLGPFTVTLEQVAAAPGIVDVRVRLASGEPAPPPQFSLVWSVPSVDVAGFWNTNISLDKISYYRQNVSSRATSGAPALALYNGSDVNRFTFAVMDALNRIDIGSYLREEDGRFHQRITFFVERHPAITEYETTIRFDTRPVPFHTALGAVSAWWAGIDTHRPAPVPDGARAPLYSTWYSFHQNLVVEDVLEELRLAAGLGYEAVIVDDGWQTLDNQRGYRYTGDWQPTRIPDMRAFVDSTHALGMDFLLWYSVPLVGERAANFPRFRGKYLRYWESQGAYVLDPRYPEVREFIIATYEQAMDDWGLDGFKLDFMGFFAANDSTVLTAAGGRDHASVNAAVDRLMTDIMTRLRAKDPDIMIEFRQPYIGPLMRKYGNMFRSVDCPNNATQNRVQVTDVRLLAGNPAVHSDMFMWNEQEPVEVAARQLLSVLFSVPQLSVRLSDTPEEHRRMLRFWTEYWKEYRHVLLDGTFRPIGPGAAYPVLLGSADGITIAGVYADAVVPIDGQPTDLHLVNGKSSTRIVADLAVGLGRVLVTTFDAEGWEVGSRTERLGAGIHAFDVPPSGLVTISRL